MLCAGAFARALRRADHSEELKQKLDAGEDIVVIDVRHSLDFEADPYIIPGALIIPGTVRELSGSSA
jgi:rhodanese-related sulfurtransferase